MKEIKENRMKVSEELHYWKEEAKSRHSMGEIVPSWLYEKIHSLEKMTKQEKHEKNESNISS